MRRTCAEQQRADPAAPPRADGMLIYQLLGDAAQQSFARSWGVSYGVGAAAEWRDVAKEVAQAVALMVLLEWLCLTRNTRRAARACAACA